MNTLKATWTTVILLSASLTQAQTRLDDLQLNLPPENNWIEGMSGYERDSLVRLQTWYLKKPYGQRYLVVSISSVIKTGKTEGVSKIKKLMAQSDKITLLDEGKIAEKYPYVLFKAPANEERVNQLGATLMMFMETETSVHTVMVQSENRSFLMPL